MRGCSVILTLLLDCAITSLPPGIVAGHQINWNVIVLSTDGGTGSSETQRFTIQ